jgi:hypothetical protein
VGERIGTVALWAGSWGGAVATGAEVLGEPGGGGADQCRAGAREGNSCDVDQGRAPWAC